jgi:hypothetical protein
VTYYYKYTGCGIDPEAECAAKCCDESDILEYDDHIKYITGYPDGSVGPERRITRAEVAMIFYRLLKDAVTFCTFEKIQELITGNKEVSGTIGL